MYVRRRGHSDQPPPPISVAQNTQPLALVHIRPTHFDDRLREPPRSLKLPPPAKTCPSHLHLRDRGGAATPSLPNSKFLHFDGGSPARPPVVKRNLPSPSPTPASLRALSEPPEQQSSDVTLERRSPMAIVHTQLARHVREGAPSFHSQLRILGHRTRALAPRGLGRRLPVRPQRRRGHDLGRHVGGARRGRLALVLDLDVGAAELEVADLGLPHVRHEGH